MNSELVETIAQQIDHMKPDEYQPGRDVGMTVLGDCLLVSVVPTNETFFITYDEGMDLYSVSTEDKELTGVYCDQLGEIIFGDKAKPWTQPFGSITDGDGNVTEF